MANLRLHIDDDETNIPAPLPFPKATAGPLPPAATNADTQALAQDLDRVFDRIDHLLTGLAEDADEVFRFPDPDDDGPRAA